MCWGYRAGKYRVLTQMHTPLRAPSCSLVCLHNVLYRPVVQPYSSSAQTPSLAGALPASLLLCPCGPMEGCWVCDGLMLTSRSPEGCPWLWCSPLRAGCPLLFSLLLPSIAGISSSPQPLWWVLPGLLTHRVLLDQQRQFRALSKKSLQSLGEE